MQEEKKEILDGVMSDDELDAVGGGIACACLDGLGYANRAVCNCITGLSESSNIHYDCACLDGLGEPINKKNDTYVDVHVDSDAW